MNSIPSRPCKIKRGPLSSRGATTPVMTFSCPLVVPARRTSSSFRVTTAFSRSTGISISHFSLLSGQTTTDNTAASRQPTYRRIVILVGFTRARLCRDRCPVFELMCIRAECMYFIKPLFACRRSHRFDTAKNRMPDRTKTGYPQYAALKRLQ